jgi:ATP-dependent Lon protease
MSRQNRSDFSQFASLVDALSGFEDEPLSSFQRLDTDGFMTCPLLPLRDVVIFPQMVMPLFIGRQRSLAAIQAALHNRENLVVAAQRNSEVVDPGAADLYAIGTEITIGRTLRMPDDSTSVLGQGQRRVEIVEFVQWDPYIRVKVRPVHETNDWQPQTEQLMRAVLALFEKMVELHHNLPEDAYTFALNIDEPGWLSDFVAATLTLSLAERQEILEIFDPATRLQKISLALAKEIEVLQLEDQIQSQVQEEVERSHREHFLREQMRVIQGELGEADIFTQELDEMAAAVEQKELPSEARAKVERELARLRAMPPMSPEIGIIRTYVDWIVGLPWSELSSDNLDVTHAAEVLDGDHYALDKVKDRILEYIAVRQIAPDSLRSPILCFVGPPGTGKTSIGRSIADALGREFVRMSLGGVRDEAEIRGHRRTYIGALPGRVIQSMRRVGTRNPLFMLDEIDKLGNDFRGDPASALLEVLDPEQNNTFTDHYLELEFDLSQVLFITTANFLDTIPPALQDRLEVIRFSGYLEEEKLEICNQFLLPRQLEEHGLAKRGFTFETAALQTIIRHYTLEAGVRNLEREIANVCRKLARTVAEKKRVTKKITAEQVEKLLGPPKFTGEMLAEQDEIGVATGAAWTAAGGDIMFIEVNLMPGKGNLLLTGQLGDVMRESGQAALSFIRSQSEALSIDPERFEKTDIHIHLPEGAVPKDGPSAGVTLVTALASAFTNRPVRRDVAMTGEVTLRGRVLAVGGIREKALAARRAGVKTFIMPRKNESDLQTIPEKLRQDLEFVLVDRAGEVLDAALTGES